jgi:hypothetical protein
MGKESSNGLMELSTLVSGEKIEPMDEDSLFM